MRLKMVSSKKVQCAICNKKCSGNVLRYQDQYYHKPCFEQLDGRTSELSVPSQQLDSRSLQQQYSRQPPATGDSQQNIQYIQQSDLDLSSSRQTLGSSVGRQQEPTDRSRMSSQQRSSTIDARISAGNASQSGQGRPASSSQQQRSATLPHSTSVPANGFLSPRPGNVDCAACGEKVTEGNALIALNNQWHIWCFKCNHCKTPLHGEYVAKEGRAYCERDYQKLFGVACVYCKRYITGKVLQAGETHHFHPSCARCSKCGDPFVPGEEMYLQGEVTWHPRCGPGPDQGSIMDEMVYDASSKSQLHAPRAHSPSLSSRSRSRSASPFSFMSRQGGRSSPGYADSEAVGDLSRVYTISYLNADPTQGYLRRPVEPKPAKSPQFSRPTSTTRSRSSSRSQYGYSRDRSAPRGMYSVLSSMRSGSSSRARSPSMMNEEAIQMAQYPSGQKPGPDAVAKIERDDFPAPPFLYPDRVRSSSQSRSQQAATNGNGQHEEADRETPVERAQRPAQQRSSRPRSREIVIDDEDSSTDADPQLRKEEEELSKIASGIGKIFLQTLKEREKLRAWKRANLDPRNASRTPSATRELPSRMRYDNPTNASPSRDMDRPRPWEEEDGSGVGAASEHSPTRTRSSLGRSAQAASQMSSSTYGYKVVQSNRSTPKPGYGLSNGSYHPNASSTMTSATTMPSNTNNILNNNHSTQDISFNEQRRYTQNRSTDLLSRATLQSDLGKATPSTPRATHPSSSFGAAHLRRSMPNVNLHHLHTEGPPKLYPYHLLATSNYRLPPDVDRCHLERHLSNEEFQFIFHCDRLFFYRLPEWKRNELKRRAKLF